MREKAERDILHVAAAAATVILVCRKCSKKLGGGFGPEGDERLARALKRLQVEAYGKAKPRRSRTVVLEVGCLDLCPKGAVAVLHGGRPGDWLLVPRGTSLAVVEAELGIGYPQPGG